MQDRQHLGQAHRGFPAFQFDKEADANSRRRRQLVLAQALGNPGLANEGSNLFDSHVFFPIGNILAHLAAGVHYISRTVKFGPLVPRNANCFPGRENYGAAVSWAGHPEDGDGGCVVLNAAPSGRWRSA
jgi:hypothetical protein